MARLRHVTQQVQPFNLALGIEAALGGCLVRFDGMVALLPDSNDVGAQPGEPGDELNGILSIVHLLQSTGTPTDDAQHFDRLPRGSASQSRWLNREQLKGQRINPNRITPS